MNYIMGDSFRQILRFLHKKRGKVYKILTAIFIYILKLSVYDGTIFFYQEAGVIDE